MAYSSRAKIGYTGYEPFVGVFNELLVAEPSTKISLLFDYGILEGETHGTITNNVGDGVTTENNDGILEISSTTGSAQITSRDRLFYFPGHTGIARFTASLSGSGIGEIGLNDDDNGFILRDNNSVLTAIRRNNQVDTEEAINGDISDIDFTKINIFYITFGFLGVANPIIWVLDSNGQPKKVHEFFTIGVLNTVHVRTPVLPIRMSTSGDKQILSGSWNAALLGNGQSKFAQQFSQEHSVTVPVNGTATLVNYQNQTSFEYKAGVSTPNKKKSRIIRFQFFVDSPNVGQGVVRFSINEASGVSGATWANVSQYKSVMLYDNVGTPTVSKNLLYEFIGYAGANKGGSSKGAAFESEALDITTYPGDFVSIIAENLNNTEVICRVSINFQEI